jgi:hypothetical protein
MMSPCGQRRQGKVRFELDDHPCEKFLRIVGRKLLTNYLVHIEDVLASRDIFGPEVGCLKGKTTSKGIPEGGRGQGNHLDKHLVQI